MTVLAQICTFNDCDVLDRSLAALLRQTVALDEILIVDNGSVDGTLDREFPERVTVLRHMENLGTSGAAATALRYGLEKGYDWVWIFDADSEPRADALEKLLALFESFDAERAARVWLLACLAVDVSTASAHHGMVFTPTGWAPVDPPPDADHYEVDATIWSGSLFRAEAVRKIGLPRADYVLDWGENEYGYRGKVHGYVAIVQQSNPMDHNIDEPGGRVGPPERVGQLGPLRFRVPRLPPMRLYYFYRNTTYFFLYTYYRGNFLRFLRSAAGWMPRHMVKLVLMARIRPDLVACLQGLGDGLRGRMGRRYES